MKELTKTEKRVQWLIAHEPMILAARTTVRAHPGVRIGGNARHYYGMSGGGWGWWANALNRAGISSDAMQYWSGSAPTPSTAINAGIARYIRDNAPDELR